MSDLLQDSSVGPDEVIGRCRLIRVLLVLITFLNIILPPINPVEHHLDLESFYTAHWAFRNQR